MEEVVNEIKETKTKLAIAEREGDITRRNTLESYLVELQRKENLLLQQQAPAVQPGFDIGSQTLLKAIESLSLSQKDFAFNVVKGINDIKSQATFQTSTIKPSEACKSNPENIATFYRLLECLQLDCGHDLTANIESPDKTDSANGFPKFSYQWPQSSDYATSKKNEFLSYEPLLKYLQANNMNAFMINNGQLLPNGLLFDVLIHSLKSDITLKSKDLRMTGDEPRCKFHLMGRSDLVILTPDSHVISRQTTATAIEVKPVGFNVKEGLREAALQLIGLNVDNNTISASVLLTNLAKTHYVIYLKAVDINKQKFKLVVKSFEAFHDAIAMVHLLHGRPCITKHFGSPPTPESSESESNLVDGDDTDYANVILRVDDGTEL
mmetsp:Transcript_14141/g.21092  ORF Transcript_14141/g.21092 Transcript_14141/m.21092 type:complete len:380 (-) Transcript_14141:109-1248(-)